MSRSVVRSPKSSDSSSRYLHRPASLPSWSSSARKPGVQEGSRDARSEWVSARSVAARGEAVRTGAGARASHGRQANSRELCASQNSTASRLVRASMAAAHGARRARCARTRRHGARLRLATIKDNNEHVTPSPHERDAEQPEDWALLARDRQRRAVRRRRRQRDGLPSPALCAVSEAANFAINRRCVRRRALGGKSVTARRWRDGERARCAALDDRNDRLLRTMADGGGRWRTVADDGGRERKMSDGGGRWRTMADVSGGKRGARGQGDAWEGERGRVHRAGAE